MRDILESCVRIDRAATRLYKDMQQRCDNEAVAYCLGMMAMDEDSHVGWWHDLIRAHEAGLLPDLWDDTEAVRERLRETLDILKSAVPASGPLSGGDALAAAAAMELFLVDPIFIELLDFAGPNVSDQRHEAYDRHIRRLVRAIEEHGGGLERLLGLELRRAWGENLVATRLNTHDPLTGLGNRRALEVQALQWSSWCARYGHPIALLLLDLDRFREINSVHGHAAGDATLLAVAAAVREEVRASDAAARYGSDEFAILAPDTAPDDARSLALRISGIVRDAMVASDAGLVRPTVSVGVAVALDPAGSEPRTIEELVAAADRSLYAAKQGGRDCVAAPVILSAVTPA